MISSGVEAIDVQWMAAIKGWVYQPYLGNGRAVSRCLPVRVDLNQQRR